MKAYIMIKVRAGEVRAVVTQLRKMDAVAEAHMTFGPYDAVAVVESADLSALGRLIATSIQPVPGVEQTLTCLAVDL